MFTEQSHSKFRREDLKMSAEDWPIHLDRYQRLKNTCGQTHDL